MEIKEIQNRLGNMILALTNSQGGSWTHAVPELAKAKNGSNGKVMANITYLTIPEVARGSVSMRSYLEKASLFQNQLGQFVISEATLEIALQRLEMVNVSITAAVQKLLDTYEDQKANFMVETSEYLNSKLGKRRAKKVLIDVMRYYPTPTDISSAKVSLRLDYVSGTAGLSDNTIRVVDESKASELAENYQKMVLHAVGPTYAKLGQLLDQAANSKMAEKTITAYRNAVKRLEEDNVILGNPTLANIVKCSFMAVHNSDVAEFILINIYRLAQNNGITEELPIIERYEGMLDDLAENDENPSIEDLVVRADAILATRKETENDA